MLESNTIQRNIPLAREAIRAIQNAMNTATKSETMYRGDDEQIHESHIREGFFSVTHDKEKAAEYGKVYKVILEKDVPRLSFQAEGDETLIMNGMKYTVKDDTITVSVPSDNNASAPYLGNLYQSRKMAKNKEHNAKTMSILSDLYCYSFEEPDTFGIYMGDCEEPVRTKFDTLSLEEKLRTLRKRLHEMPNREAFLAEMPVIMNVNVSQLDGIVKELMSGGRHKKELRSGQRRKKELMSGQRRKKELMSGQRRKKTRKQRKSRQKLKL
jgi:hypothetical protein